ncbi:MAG TPA: proline dehydrogenase family protein [Terriglobales bacterium]|nr:proline dehydrogenase family protein [Terriglobales bacterium]
MNLMRSALLWASQNAWLREQAPRHKFVRRTVSRFMPGEGVDDAMQAARSLAAQNIRTIFTQLGENITSALEAEQVRDHYLGVLAQIRESALPAEISVKLTQLGLDLGEDLCYRNLAPLIERAALNSGVTTLWIDMEGSAYTQRTLDLFTRARREYANAGVCVQAYLYRTKEDLERLISLGAAVRLVKGAYKEPPAVAFPRKQDVDANYFALAQRLLSADARQHGVRSALATHDRALIARMAQFAEQNGVPRTALEFQMLYGIQSAEQLRLAREGYDSRVLIAYGPHWYAWFMRRLAERPANLWFVIKNFF